MTAIPANLEIDNTTDDPRSRAPLVVGDKRSFHAITEAVSRLAERPATLAWKICFLISATFLGILGLCLAYLFATGVGVWGEPEDRADIDVALFVMRRLVLRLLSAHVPILPTCPTRP